MLIGSGCLQTFDLLPTAFVIPTSAECTQPFALPLADARIDTQDLGCRLSLAALKVIGADDYAFTTFDLALIFVRRFLNLALYVAIFNRRQSPATLVDSLDILPGSTFDLVG